MADIIDFSSGNLTDRRFVRREHCLGDFVRWRPFCDSGAGPTRGKGTDTYFGFGLMTFSGSGSFGTDQWLTCLERVLVAKPGIRIAIDGNGHLVVFVLIGPWN